MNRYQVNTPARYSHDIFIPPIQWNEDCCFSPRPRDKFLFPCVDSREEEMNPLSMNDGVDFLKLLGGVKDTAAACFRPAGSLICRHRSLRRSISDTSWTIHVLNQRRCPGDTARFKLFPSGSQACMVLQGTEIMESVEVLAAGDGTQKDIVFHVHMMHADHIETMNGDEVLEFLLMVLQCTDGGEVHVGNKGVPTRACLSKQKQKQTYSFIDESNDAISTAANHRCNRIRFPRVRRIFRKRN
jgi:hypothetical protein